MTQPCIQEQSIRILSERVISALGEIREDQKQQTAMLTALSVQDERIKHVEIDLDELKGNQREIFTRIHSLEMAPGKASSKLLWGIYGTATGGVASIVTGVTVYFLTRG